MANTQTNTGTATNETINLNIPESEAFYDALVQPILFNQKLHTAFGDHEKL